MSPTAWTSMNIEPQENGTVLRFDTPQTEIWIPVAAEDFYDAIQRQPRFQALPDVA